MKYLSKAQAEKIAAITSSIYSQGPSWVLKEWDLESGTERLTRGLTHANAKKKLKIWRREKVEELLRADGSAKAYAVRVWTSNPSWNGESIWQWAFNKWYTTKEDAEKAIQKRAKVAEGEEAAAPPSVDADTTRLEICEINTSELPGHFKVS